VTGTKRPAELAAAALVAVALGLAGCEEQATNGSIGLEEAEEIEETFDDVEDGPPYEYE
jgi:hypothetical protein